MCAPHAVHRTCDTQLDAAGWEASVNDVALDVEVGWAQVAGDGVKHKSTYGSEWTAQRYRTLLHVVTNWIASGNAADNLNDLFGRRSLSVVGTGNRVRL
jgi:hypothetical protein